MDAPPSGRGEGIAALLVGLVIEVLLLCEGWRERTRARAIEGGAKCSAADGARGRPGFTLDGVSEDAAVASFRVEVGAEVATSATGGSL